MGMDIKQRVEFIWKIKVIYVKEIFFSQSENISPVRKISYSMFIKSSSLPE